MRRRSPKSRRAGARRIAAAAIGAVGAAALLAACKPDSTDYFPLKPGWIWEYQIDAAMQSVGKEKSKLILTDRSWTTIDGVNALPRLAADGHVYYYADEKDGVALVADQPPGEARHELSGEYILKYPLNAGASWQVQSHTLLLRRQGFSPTGVKNVALETPITVTYTVAANFDTVTVPAGTFRNCLHLHGEGSKPYDLGDRIGRVTLSVNADEWYAPGVGLVKMTRKEDSAPESPVSGSMTRVLTRIDKPGWFE